jgi:hypothetical protein
MDDQIDSTVEDVQEEPVEQSMDDTIRQTLEEINARGTEPEETTEQAEQRARDEKGRFAPKEPEAEPIAEQVAEVVEPEPLPVTVSPELQKLGLRKEEAEAFSRADKAVQDAFIRRSEEMHRGFEQFRGKAQFGDAMERAITPFMSVIQQAGVTPDVAVSHLLRAESALRNGSPDQKVQMLTQLARDYGIDLGQANEYAANIPMPDPRVQQLEARLQQQESWINQQNQAREWQERQSLNSDIQKFASDPTNAHFEEVRNDMAGLLQAGLAPDLKTAYEMAIYANPTVRTQVLAKQQAETEAQRRAEATQKARDAKAAAAVNITRKGTLPSAKAVGTMDDTIRETAQRLGLIS